MRYLSKHKGTHRVWVFKTPRESAIFGSEFSSQSEGLSFSGLWFLRLDFRDIQRVWVFWVWGLSFCILVPRVRDPFGQHQEITTSGWYRLSVHCFNSQSKHSFYLSPPESEILGADQKDRGLWGRFWGLSFLSYPSFFAVSWIKKLFYVCFVIERWPLYFTFGMKIRDMVAVAGNMIHTPSAAYSCSYCSLFNIRARNAPIVDKTTTLYTQIPITRESLRCAYTTFLVS